MKDGLENIDEIFKKAFDGFESNVDPSVWNNVQSSIGSGAGSTPQVDPSTITGIVGKSLAVKIIAGVALVGTVATSVYFIPNLFEDEEITVVENTVIEDNLTKITKELNTSVAVDRGIIENSAVLVDESENKDELIKGEGQITSEKSSRSTNKVGNGDIENTSTETSRETVGAATSDKTIAQVQKNDKKPEPKTVEPSKVEKAVTELDVSINVDVVKGKAPLTVQFDAIGNGVNYLWEFSDGFEEFGNSPIHIFSIERTYRVKLTAQDNLGNSKVVYKTIIVEKDYNSSINRPLQNIFSPNGDGENDFVKIRGKNIAKLQVKIVDSKGRVVYFMNSIDDKWEGKDQNGNYLIQGQYRMAGMATGTDGKTHYIKQVITLRE